MRFLDGTADRPVLIDHASEGFVICRERNRPTVCKVPSGLLCRYFPSGQLDHLARECQHAAVFVYGIARDGGEVADIVRWRSGEDGEPPAAAVEWVSGELWDGSQFITLPGRNLYKAPRGWRRPNGHVGLPELAEAIENACRDPTL